MALLDFTKAPHGGSQRHLPEWQSQPPITPLTIIDHSIVGTGESAFNLFKDRSVLESHFIVCGKGDTADGMIWQLMDTSRQADANLNANSYAISIETGDQGDPDRQPWTANQLRSLIWLHNELIRLHPSILRRESRSCQDPSGLGYHTLHGAPSCWTPVSKTCPGTVRKTQWRDVVLPAFLASSIVEEEDMAQIEGLSDQAIKDFVTAIDRGLTAGLVVTGQKNSNGTLQVLVDQARETNRKLDLLIALMTPAPPPPAPPA